jgi:hypothetical protein
MNTTIRMAACLLSLAGLIGVTGASQRATKTPQRDQTAADHTVANHDVHLVMQNVNYHFTDDIAVHIARLEGKLVSRDPRKPPIFDDKNSFTLSLNVAQISIGLDSLAHAFNEYVFAFPDAPIKSVTVEAKGNALLVKGKLNQKGDISFETTGTLSPTSTGQIRIHTEKIKAAHLPVKGLLDLLGMKLANLVNTKKVAGITAEGNDLILDPNQALPPPHIQGKVTDVYIQGNQIVQVFGDKQQKETGQESGNFMAYRGASLRFGKLTMNDTDMVLSDMDPQDPFDFYLDHYKDQLVAGYTKTTKDFGLRVYMRDYDKLQPASVERSTLQKTP